MVQGSQGFQFVLAPHVAWCKMIAVPVAPPQHCIAKCFIATPARPQQQPCGNNNHLRVASGSAQRSLAPLDSMCVWSVCPALRLVGIPLHFIMAKHAFIMLEGNPNVPPTFPTSCLFLHCYPHCAGRQMLVRLADVCVTCHDCNSDRHAAISS